MKKTPSWMTRAACFAPLAFALVGCGTGVEPLTALSQGGSQTLEPSLELPISTTTAAGQNVYGSISQYVTGQAEYFDIVLLQFAQDAKAPAAGVITAIDAATNGVAVTIRHN